MLSQKMKEREGKRRNGVGGGLLKDFLQADLVKLLSNLETKSNKQEVISDLSI